MKFLRRGPAALTAIVASAAMTMTACSKTSLPPDDDISLGGRGPGIVIGKELKTTHDGHIKYVLVLRYGIGEPTSKTASKQVWVICKVDNTFYEGPPPHCS
jgi:hypothetical protein